MTEPEPSDTPSSTGPAAHRGDFLDLDVREAAIAWEHAHVDGSDPSHPAWSGRRRPVRFQR